MRTSVLIVEDSRSTADLARLALAGLSCSVEVAVNAGQALDLVRNWLSPAVMVIDAHLPGVQTLPFVITLQSEAPTAAVVLLLDRGSPLPPMPLVEGRLFKPLQPRRLASAVTALLAEAGRQGGAGGC